MSEPDYKALYEEASRRADKERQRADEERQRSQKTTLTKYLDLCHTHLSQTISIQNVNRMTTSGDAITKPDGKLRPSRLLPWTSYLDDQRQIFVRLLKAYPVDTMQRLFESGTFVTELGERVAGRKLASELDLQFLQRETVETPVTHIIRHFYAVEHVCREFGLTGHITFDNHPNTLSVNADEVAERLQQQHLEPSTPRYSSSSLRGLKADQICVYFMSTDEETLRKVLLVVEYKAPHKLTTESLRLGFHPMDLKDVVNRSTVPTSEDQQGLFQYHADRVVASVVTQLYNYMIEGGIRYRYIATGQAFIFLHVPQDDEVGSGDPFRYMDLGHFGAAIERRRERRCQHSTLPGR